MARNRNCCQKSKILSKTQFVDKKSKNRSFFNHRNFSQQSNFFLKIEIFLKKRKFSEKSKFFSKNRFLSIIEIFWSNVLVNDRFFVKNRKKMQEKKSRTDCRNSHMSRWNHWPIIMTILAWTWRVTRLAFLFRSVFD